jgi:hypothetical protein
MSNKAEFRNRKERAAHLFGQEEQRGVNRPSRNKRQTPEEYDQQVQKQIQYLQTLRQAIASLKTLRNKLGRTEFEKLSEFAQLKQLFAEKGRTESLILQASRKSTAAKKFREDWKNRRRG